MGSDIILLSEVYECWEKATGFDKQGIAGKREEYGCECQRENSEFQVLRNEWKVRKWKHGWGHFPKVFIIKEKTDLIFKTSVAVQRCSSLRIL